MLNKHKSWFKALSFLCILSLILSIVPPVGLWQSVKAADTDLYNGGYTSYNGYDYTWWVKNEAKVKDSNGNLLYRIKNPNNPNEVLYFNCEIYAERGQVVYGTPDDVPKNHLVSPPGFKPAADGYFYAVKQSDGSYRLAMPGTPGAVRGWFRYMGYTKDSVEFPDPKFPPDGNGKDPVVYSNIIAQPWNNAVCQSLIPGISNYRPTNIDSTSWNTIWNARYNLVDKNGSGQRIGDLFTSLSDLQQKSVFMGVDSQGNGTITIFHKVNGTVYYRSYTGFIPKGGNVSVSTKSASCTIDSYSYLTIISGSSSNIDGAVLRYNPATNQSPSVNVFITGSLIFSVIDFL